MILDELSELADAVAIDTGVPGLYRFGDVIDTGAVASGFSADLWLVLRVATTFASVGAAKARFHIVSDAQSLIAIDGTTSFHFSTGALAVAQLTAGTVVAAFKLSEHSHERYVGVLQETVAAAFTAGALDVFVASDFAAWRPYAANV